MKKTITLLMFLMSFLNLFSQEDSPNKVFYESFLGAKKVIINKRVASYNASFSRIVSNKKIESDFKLDAKNPYNIYITSSEFGAQIRINSNKIREDIVLPFKIIYKAIGTQDIEYHFDDGGNSIKAVYYIPLDGSHQMLFVTIKDSDGNGSYLQFVISKLEQL